MTAAIIDGLELVEVDEQERKWCLVAQRSRNLAVQLLVERPMIAEAGQGIAQGVGQRRLVADLEIRLGCQQRCYGAPQSERGEGDGTHRCDDDRGRLVIREQRQTEPVDGREDEHGEHGPGKKASCQTACTGGRARRAGICGIHAGRLRVPLFDPVRSGIAERRHCGNWDLRTYRIP